MNQIVPLSNAPNQSLIVSLNINGRSTDYLFNLHYNEISGYWLLGISDTAGNLILSAVPLLTGESPAGNILGQFAYLGIGGATIINASQAAIDYPDSASLGSDFFLVWYDN